MRRPVVLVTLVVLLAGCDGSAEDGQDVPLGPAAAASGVSPSPSVSPTPEDFTPKTLTMRKAIPPASVLGSGWTGPSQISTGFPSLERYVQSCSQSSTVRKRQDSRKPRQGGYGFYDSTEENVSLSQVSTGSGADTIARATEFLAFLRTVPQACPSGKVLDKYPFTLTAEDGGSDGDETLRLRATVTLPEPYEPLLLDLGYVRQGGLVVVFYGEKTQVDEFLPGSFEYARDALTGSVPGI